MHFQASNFPSCGNITCKLVKSNSLLKYNLQRPVLFSRTRLLRFSITIFAIKVLSFEIPDFKINFAWTRCFFNKIFRLRKNSAQLWLQIWYWNVTKANFFQYQNCKKSWDWEQHWLLYKTAAHIIPQHLLKPL